MNRRGFLQLLGAGLPAAVVCEKVGLLERVRTYFFAPQIGWNPVRISVGDQVIALQLEHLRKQLPTIFENDLRLFDVFSVDGATKRGRIAARVTGYNTIEWDKAITL